MKHNHGENALCWLLATVQFLKWLSHSLFGKTQKTECQAQTNRTGMLGFINLKALLMANNKEGLRQAALVIKRMKIVLCVHE